MRESIPKSPSHAKSDAEVTSKWLQSRLHTPKVTPKVTQSDMLFIHELYKIIEICTENECFSETDLLYTQGESTMIAK